jgi:hypothetical protein
MDQGVLLCVEQVLGSPTRLIPWRSIFSMVGLGLRQKARIHERSYLMIGSNVYHHNILSMIAAQ